MEPAHSPPTPIPCIRRRATSNMGAQTPIVLKSGNNPINVLLSPIIHNVTINALFLPIRSPKCPKMIAPIGRAKNPLANVAKDNIVAIYGFSPGKNSLGKITAEAVAYKKKSYHSITPPSCCLNELTPFVVSK